MSKTYFPWPLKSLPFNSSFGGSRDGAVARALASHQCGPGSIPGLGVISGLSLLLVRIFASRDFSPGSPVFPSPQKPTIICFVFFLPFAKYELKCPTENI